ncbi:MAG: hypothetical protein K6E67_10335 [Prevotella sp.]|nr:hypothetical protein [Prevotella sp.]
MTNSTGIAGASRGGEGGGSAAAGDGSADYATNAGHADTADEATHAASADTADEATHATSAANLDADSTDWAKILRKDIADTATEIITFAKGLVSTLVAKFKAGIKIGANDAYEIDANGNATLNNIEVEGDSYVSGDETVVGDMFLQSHLSGVTASFTDVTARKIGRVNNPVDDILATNITTDNLTVTKEAHFFKLVVDELLSNKGAIIISNANCVAERVVPDAEHATPNYYDVYFSSVDKDGNTVTNPWKSYDLAICLTFKLEGAGTFSDVSNRYYWRLVAVLADETVDNTTYHKIRLMNTAGNYEGSTVPAAGDNIVQLGYTGSSSTNAYRQSAIILSSYPTMDAGVTPPSIAFYKGINDFNLSSHRYTYIDGLSNEFIGNFKILVNGSYTNLTTVLATIEGLISNVQKTVRGKNLIPSQGWTDVNGNLLPVENFDPDLQKIETYATGSSTGDVIYSPVIFLPAGRYTFSVYTSDSDMQLYYYNSAVNVSSASQIQSEDYIDIDSVVSGDTYTPPGGSAITRRYATFTLQSDSYVIMNPYDGQFSFVGYRPQLEAGTTATAWEIGNVEVRSSELMQTSELIRAQVGNCGLDITNEAIIAHGGKFKMQDENGNDTFVLDQDGNIVGQGNATFGGVVRAKTLFRQVMQANTYYQSANFANADHSSLNADFMIVMGTSSTFTVNFPPAYLFEGALVRIITGRQNLITYTLQIGRLSGEDGPHEDAYNVPQANFYAGIPFRNSAGTDIYGYRGQLDCNTYRTIDLIATKNPENTAYYVWMVIDAK